MNIKIFRLALIAFIIIATIPTAFGADNSAVNWGGYYAGVNLGESFGINKVDYTHNISICGNNNFGSDGGGGCGGSQNFSDSIQHSSNDFTGGIHAGYNWNVNPLVVGVESSISFKNQENFNEQVISSAFGDTLGVRTKQNYSGSLKVDLGVPVDKFLFYANGGLSAGDVKTSIIQTASGYPSRSFDQTDFNLGYTVGTGVKYKLGTNWIVGGEYSYVDLGTSKISADRFVAPSTIVYPDTSVKTRNTANIAQLTLSYQF